MIDKWQIVWGYWISHRRRFRPNGTVESVPGELRQTVRPDAGSTGSGALACCISWVHFVQWIRSPGSKQVPTHTFGTARNALVRARDSIPARSPNWICSIDNVTSNSPESTRAGFSTSKSAGVKNDLLSAARSCCQNRDGTLYAARISLPLIS
jgi:hypothetical protein